MRPVFIGGCDRSGTTLLAALLAGNQRVVSPPEAQFFLEGLVATRGNGGDDPKAFADFIRNSWRFHLWELPVTLPEEIAQTCSGSAEVMSRLARAYAEQVEREGADIWVDHTPFNIGYAPTLLREFDDAPMVHIVRDPRAVVASVLPLDWGPSSARAGARWWLSIIAMGLVAEAHFPGRVIRVHFEDLVRNPQHTLERLCADLELAFESNMVEPKASKLPAYTRDQHALVGRTLDPARIDAWKMNLSKREIAVMEGELKDVPAMLGYETLAVAPRIATNSSVGEFLASTLQSARQRWQHRARVRRALNADRRIGGGKVSYREA